jgi:hypothetical protein
MKDSCPLHGEQEFMVNENLDAFCGVCYAEKIERLLAVTQHVTHKNKMPDGAILIEGPLSEERPRCLYTKNMCGTDTWAVGHVCSCAACQKWFRSLFKDSQEMIRWGVGGNPLVHD